MRFLDVASMALLMIRQQKTRTALSLIGVVIGSLMLLYSLSARRGVQDAVDRVFSMSKQMRQIEVHPRWEIDEETIPAEALRVEGELDEAMRLRIRKMLVRQYQINHGREMVGLTRQRIKRIEALKNVQSVRPETGLYVTLVQGEHELRGRAMSVATADEVLQKRILTGNMFESDSDQAILLNEFIAWKWGFRSLSRMRQLVGAKLRIEYRVGAESVANSISFRSGGDIEFSDEEIAALNRALDRIPAMVDQLPLPERERAALKKAFPAADEAATEPVERVISQEYRVAGFFRGPNQDEIENRVRLGNREDFVEFLLPIKTATQFALRFPHAKKWGFYRATVMVDHESYLKTVSEQIRAMGLAEHSLISLVEFIKHRVREATLIVSLIAVFALVVSGLGIANTMVMSVVERTREIGIMKALGAREGQIQTLFLIEGALLGLIGGIIALLIGLVIRIPIESLTISILEDELNKTFEQEHVLEFSLWLLGSVVAFSTAVTTLATILPARRAARIDPIAPLRRE